MFLFFVKSDQVYFIYYLYHAYLYPIILFSSFDVVIFSFPKIWLFVINMQIIGLLDFFNKQVGELLNVLVYLKLFFGRIVA